MRDTLNDQDGAPPPEVTRETFATQAGLLRPKMHRYCARMTGSAIEAEDIVQDALASALSTWPDGGVHHPEAWLIRITHNKAIDHLRKSGRYRAEPLEDQDTIDPAEPPLEAEATAKFALSVFLQLTPLQRASVLLKDVMGYSLSEISTLLDQSIGATKAALSRARANLKKLAAESQDQVPLPLDPVEAALLVRYVERFGARDFDGVRQMLQKDVSLDLVTRLQKRGADQVGRYFSSYAALDTLSATAGRVEGRPAMLVTSGSENYLIMLDWRGGKVSSIRDFHFAPYILESTAFSAL